MRFFAPLIRQWRGGPVLATSTKPDLVELTLDARRIDDRPVLVFDPPEHRALAAPGSGGCRSSERRTPKPP